MKKYRLLSTLLLLSLFLAFAGDHIRAAEPVQETADAPAEETEGDTEVDPDKTAVIHVELEKENAMMGVSVYQVGKWTEDGFSYIQPYADLVTRDYYLVNTQNELKKQIRTVAEYIEKNGAQESGRIKVADGTGASAELPVGLYILIQNADGSNAKMDEPLYVEAPAYSASTGTYLYEIHVYPKWEASIWFSFRPEVVYPMILICALIICAFLCLFGARIIRSLFVAALAILSGLAGFQLGMKYTNSYLVSMVAFVFLGYIAVFILFYCFSYTKKKRKRTNAITTFEWVLVYATPVIGAVCAGFLIYHYLSGEIWFYLAIPAVVAIGGLLLQIRNTKNRRIFYTYDDLIETKDKGDGKIRVWFWLNMLASVVYLFWRIFFTIPIGYGVVANVAGTMLLFVEALGLVEAIVHYSNMNNSKEYRKPEIAPELFPDVDVFVATYSEEAELLKKTLLGCKRMEYPDKSKVHIYICDDGHREEIKKLAAQIGINYLDREDHSGHKAGNLNNALAHSSSPYVVTFDADMIPQSAFLMETIPYFVDADLKNAEREEKDRIKLGFLQTPQAFYDVDLFQFNLHSESKIPNEQDYFYRDIEVARTRTNSCIYGGSNTVISREALEAIGGFYTEAITEDFATGILIQKAGFVSLAIPKQLASGISAKTLRDLIQQRVRWARGVISTGRKVHIYTSRNLSFGQKINYWASIWYWYAPVKRFFYIMSPILYATFGFMVFRCTFWEVLLFWLPMYFTSNMNLKTLSNHIRNTKWTSIYEYALFPYMLIPVILETVGVSLKQFKVTSKKAGHEEKDSYAGFMVPIIMIIILSVIGVIRGIYIIFESGSIGPMVVLFWLVYNLYSMIMCLFFVDGRKKYRTAERVYAQVDGELHVGDKVYPCITRDMSENGLAILLDKPILVNDDESSDVHVILNDGKWKTRFWVDIKHTDQNRSTGDKWLYTFAIRRFESDDSYDQYLALLYDRVPTNPTTIVNSNGVYDDLSTNIGRRLTVASFLKRMYPRIRVDCMIPVEVNGTEKQVKVLDFNYQYFTTGEEILPREADDQAKREDQYTFILGQYRLGAEFERKLEHYYLYRVLDFARVYFDEDQRDQIMETILKIREEHEKAEEQNG